MFHFRALWTVVSLLSWCTLQTKAFLERMG